MNQTVIQRLLAPIVDRKRSVVTEADIARQKYPALEELVRDELFAAGEKRFEFEHEGSSYRIEAPWLWVFGGVRVYRLYESYDMHGHVEISRWEFIPRGSVEAYRLLNYLASESPA